VIGPSRYSIISRSANRGELQKKEVGPPQGAARAAVGGHRRARRPRYAPARRCGRPLHRGARGRRQSTAAPRSSDCRRSLSTAGPRSRRRGRDGSCRGRSQRPTRRVRPSKMPTRSAQAPRSSVPFRLVLSVFFGLLCCARWRLAHSTPLMRKLSLRAPRVLRRRICRDGAPRTLDGAGQLRCDP